MYFNIHTGTENIETQILSPIFIAILGVLAIRSPGFIITPITSSQKS